jgi:hypothetical protein
VLVPDKPSLILVGEARSLSYSELPPEGCFAAVGSCLTRKHLIRLERFAGDRHSSFVRMFVNYGRKKFHNIGPREH